MTITARIGDNLPETVKVDLLNTIWVAVQTTATGLFKVEHDGEPKLSQLANHQFDKWGKHRWK